jgi:hypothetical protein
MKWVIIVSSIFWNSSSQVLFIIVIVFLDKKVIFSLTSKYLATPMEISQGGGFLEVQIFHMDQMMIKQ